MLKYLIINLSDNSSSFCYYNSSSNCRLISIQNLRKGFVYAMKRNLAVQLLYPPIPLPSEYDSLVSQYEIIKIKPIKYKNDADVIILNHWKDVSLLEGCEDNLIIRTSIHDLFTHYNIMGSVKAKNIHLIFSDIENFTKEDIEKYKEFLMSLMNHCIQNNVQIGTITDRMILDEMNNCNAGIESISLAPNGKFYICPAFYYEDEKNCIGDLENDINIPNRQLYAIDHSPLCRICDAYQCKRCVWLNHKMTLEVNIPSWQQCVISHIERNASREMLIKIKENYPNYLGNKEICEINYLDPFETIVEK